MLFSEPLVSLIAFTKVYFNWQQVKILVIMWLINTQGPTAGHIFHWFLACRRLGYIRLLFYKDILNGYITSKTRLAMWLNKLAGHRLWVQRIALTPLSGLLSQTYKFFSCRLAVMLSVGRPHLPRIHFLTKLADLLL